MNEHEKQRRELWLKAWCSVAGSIDCKTPYDATDWANYALRQFDIKFQKPKQQRYKER